MKDLLAQIQEAGADWQPEEVQGVMIQFKRVDWDEFNQIDKYQEEIQQVTCNACNADIDLDGLAEADDDIPRCPDCGSEDLDIPNKRISRKLAELILTEYAKLEDGSPAHDPATDFNKIPRVFCTEVIKAFTRVVQGTEGALEKKS